MPGIATVGGLPGWGTQQDALPRRIFWSNDKKVFAPGGLVIDGTNSRDLTNLSVANAAQYDVLQAGLVMGRITASGFYTEAIIGVTNVAYNNVTSNTSVSTTAAVASEIVRRIGTVGYLTFTGPPTANAASTTVAVQNVAFNAVNVTSGVITINAIMANTINGTFISASDGSATPKCLIGKEDGIEIMDRFSNYYNAQFPEPVVGGCLLSTQIINYPTDTGLIAWLKAQLELYGYGYIFSDDF